MDTTTIDYTGAAAQTNLPAGTLGTIMAVFGAFMLVWLIIAVFMIVCIWRIFKKAGKPGWAALVPFYNFYVMLEVAQMPQWWLWVLIGCVVGSFIPFVNFITPLVSIAVSIMLAINLAKAFGKETGFAILLILLPVVGYPMLAFGKVRYQGTAGLVNTPPVAPTAPTAPAEPVAAVSNDETPQQ